MDIRYGNARVVFLVGAHRSGTNMTVWALDKHPDLTLINEDNPIAFENFYLRDKYVIDEVIKYSPSKYILFKPIFDTWRVLSLLKEFPETKALFIYRKVDSMAKSFVQEFGLGGKKRVFEDFIEPMHEGSHPVIGLYPDTDFSELIDVINEFYSSQLDLGTSAALYWYFVNKIFEILRLYDEPSLKLICYEKLVAEPSLEMQKVAAFTGLEYLNEMGDAIKPTERWLEVACPINPKLLELCQKQYLKMNTYL